MPLIVLRILRIYLIVGGAFALVLAWRRESWKYDPRWKELRFLLGIVTLGPAGAALVIAAILVMAVIGLIAWVLGTVFFHLCKAFPQLGRKWEGLRVVTCNNCGQETLKAWTYGSGCDRCCPHYYP